MSPESQGRSRRRLVERGVTRDVVVHAETLACDDHSLRVMEQPIQDGRGQGAVMGEERGPLLEGAVRGEKDRPVCLAQTDDWEAQISASLGNGESAPRVEDAQRGFGVLLACLFETPSTPGGSKRVAHRNGAGKEHGGALEAGGRAQRRRQGGCAQAHAPENEAVGCVADPLEAEVVVHLEVVHAGGPVPAELLHGCDAREARQTDAPRGGASAPHGRLACKEPGQGVHMRPLLLCRVCGPLRLVPSPT